MNIFAPLAVLERVEGVSTVVLTHPGGAAVREKVEYMEAAECRLLGVIVASVALRQGQGGQGREEDGGGGGMHDEEDW